MKDITSKFKVGDIIVPKTNRLDRKCINGVCLVTGNYYFHVSSGYSSYANIKLVDEAFELEEVINSSLYKELYENS